MPRLCLSNSNGAEYHPVEHAVRILCCQTKNRAATTDLNVVGMGTQAQDVQRTRAIGLEVKPDQAPTPADGWPFFHKHQGAFPVASSSSRICLSRKVSMHCQK